MDKSRKEISGQPEVNDRIDQKALHSVLQVFLQLFFTVFCSIFTKPLKWRCLRCRLRRSPAIGNLFAPLSSTNLPPLQECLLPRLFGVSAKPWQIRPREKRILDSNHGGQGNNGQREPAALYILTDLPPLVCKRSQLQQQHMCQTGYWLYCSPGGGGGGKKFVPGKKFRGGLGSRALHAEKNCHYFHSIWNFFARCRRTKSPRRGC